MSYILPRSTGRLLLPIAVVLLTLGCSDKNEITKQAHWLCLYDHHEKPEPLAEEGDQLDRYIHPADLAELESKLVGPPTGLFARFAEEAESVILPMAFGGRRAVRKKTTCSIDEVSIEGDLATVSLSRTAPNLDLGLLSVARLFVLDDEAAIERQFDEWIETRATMETTTHTLNFQRTEAGWRARVAR